MDDNFMDGDEIGELGDFGDLDEAEGFEGFEGLEGLEGPDEVHDGKNVILEPGDKPTESKTVARPTLPPIDLKPEQLFREPDGTFNKNAKHPPVAPLVGLASAVEKPADAQSVTSVGSQRSRRSKLNMDDVLDHLSVSSIHTKPKNSRAPSHASIKPLAARIKQSEDEKIERIVLTSKIATLRTDKYTTTVDPETAPLPVLRKAVEVLQIQKKRDMGITGYEHKTKMFVNALQFEEERWNLLGLKLKGWSLQVNAMMPEFRPIFGEMFDEYGEMFKFPPVVTFGAMLAWSAYTCHKANAGEPVSEGMNGFVKSVIPTNVSEPPAPKPQPLIGRVDPANLS